jgi:hypothetical protein
MAVTKNTFAPEKGRLTPAVLTIMTLRGDAR